MSERDEVKASELPDDWKPGDSAIVLDDDAVEPPFKLETEPAPSAED